MSRTPLAAEIGFRLTGLDADSGVDVLFGSGAPGGDTSHQDDAPIGSLYLRTNGSIYTKIADANSTADWISSASVKAVEVTGVTTLQDIDTVLVDNVHFSEWELVAFEEATPVNKQFMKVSVLHNGTASADATAVDETVHTKLKTGANFNLVISVDLNGTGASQTMRLRASSSTGGVTIQARRTVVLESI